MSQPEKMSTLVSRLNALISEMERQKRMGNLKNNYYIVLTEMKNLRDGKQIGE